MADPLTSSIRFTQAAVGGDTNTWGTLLNSNWTYADAAINQALGIVVPNANVVLVADGTAADQARYHRLVFTGALTADRVVTLPAVARDGWATNSTTGGHNIVLSTGTGAALSIAPGNTVLYTCTGSSISSLSGSIAGGTVNDPVTFNGTLTVNAASTWYGTAQFLGGMIVSSIITLAVGTPFVRFFLNATPVGSITTNGTTTIYGTTSDYRLKTVHGPADGALIHGIEVHDAAFTAQPERRYPMVMAHELARIAPFAVHGEKDAVDENSNIVPQMADVSKLVPALIAYAQQLERRIAALERGYVRL